MRKTPLPLALMAAAFILFACKKESNHVTSTGFNGVWEYMNQFGFPGMYDSFAPPGNGKIIVLSANHRYEKRQHNRVLFKGWYYLKRQRDCYTDRMRTYFITNDPAFPKGAYIDNISGMLYLQTGCEQGNGTILYDKIGG